MQHTATSSAASSEHILFAHALSRQAEFHVTGLLDGIVLILAIADDEVVQLIYLNPNSYLPSFNAIRVAMDRFHSSSVSDSLPCGEAQFEGIYAFVEQKLHDVSPNFSFRSSTHFSDMFGAFEEFYSANAMSDVRVLLTRRAAAWRSALSSLKVSTNSLDVSVVHRVKEVAEVLSSNACTGPVLSGLGQGFA
ncbi:hypothetical protein TYRP_023170 [Tyrophagus putrescentiae]|nr:hypothetical protein TYRP_023170 [Tyrophagus putrescentiae]